MPAAALVGVLDALELPLLVLAALGKTRAGDAALPSNRGDEGGLPKRESWSSSSIVAGTSRMTILF
jgi:hypothetical protein